MAAPATQSISQDRRALEIVQVHERRDWMVMAGLLLLATVTRLPFTEKIFYHWDSINFAFALQHFDVAASQPQMPGYIVYVFLARLVSWLTGDAQSALVGISIAGGALATVALYLLGKEMYGQTVGLIAALFLASSPLFWFYGEIALPHTLDAFMVIVAVWLLYRISQGEARLLVPAAIWLALAGGLRQQTELFLAPLAVYAVWRARPWQSRGWGFSLAVLGILALANLFWLVPLMALSGGVSGYLATLRAFTAFFNTTTSIFSDGGAFGLVRNITKLSMYTAYGWALPFFFAGLGAIKVLLTSRPLTAWISGTIRDNRFWIFACWIGPTLGYYVLVHMGQQGLVFVYLPALLLLSALGTVSLGLQRRTWGKLALAGVILANSAILLFGPEYPLGSTRIKLLTVDTLRQHDQYYLDRFAAIRQQFSPQSTLLISSEWRFPQYYMPDYVYVPYGIVWKWEEGEGLPMESQNLLVDPASLGLKPDSHGMYTLVLLDDDLIPYNQSSDRAATVNLPDGSHMAVLHFGTSEMLYVNPSDFGIVQSTASK